VAILAEPVGATLLAAVVLHEPPTPAQIGGGALVLAGIALAARAGTNASS
jgi:drug/metabolite transporter (DMT)-like permease